MRFTSLTICILSTILAAFANAGVGIDLGKKLGTLFPIAVQADNTGSDNFGLTLTGSVGTLSGGNGITITANNAPPTHTTGASATVTVPTVVSSTASRSPTDVTMSFTTPSLSSSESVASTTPVSQASASSTSSNTANSASSNTANSASSNTADSTSSNAASSTSSNTNTIASASSTAGGAYPTMGVSVAIAGGIVAIAIL